MSARGWRRFGPGLLVTAAFVGPGTVYTASHAGAHFGGSVLWVIGVAVVAAIVLQEMAARFGLVTRKDLGAGLVQAWPSTVVQRLVAALILGAILIGNAAYQAGNLTGAATGLAALAGGNERVWIAVATVLAGLALVGGGFPLLQKILIGMVIAMSLVFVGAAILVLPKLQGLSLEAFRPRLPDAGLWSVMALLGTTVVPYNLFLHARSVQEKWGADEGLPRSLSEARWDAALSIALGGGVTLAILLTAMVTFHLPGIPLEKLGQMADQLVPVAGGGARLLFALGLFAAGLTSAITAPLAAAFATAGCLGWGGGWQDRRFRMVALAVVAVGAVAAMFAGGSPRAVILFAQAANGLLLPIVAVFLIVAMNRRQVLGEYVNGRVGNVVGVLVIALIVLFAGRKLVLLF